MKMLLRTSTISPFPLFVSRTFSYLFHLWSTLLRAQKLLRVAQGLLLVEFGALCSISERTKIILKSKNFVMEKERFPVRIEKELRQAFEKKICSLNFFL